MPDKNRHPLRGNRLKRPGQDADDELQRFVEDHLLAPGAALFVIALLAAQEWLHYWSNSPPNPWIYTLWFFAAFAVVVYHCRRQWKAAIAKKLGRDGERAVAEYLATWLETHARTLHNVPLGSNGIVDHLLICGKGVFVIETKTRSLPKIGKPLVHIGDSGLREGGFWPDRDPLSQTSRYVEAIKQLLGSNIETKIVQGIVVYPGWEIVDDRTVCSIAVLNPRSLDAYLQRQPDALTSNDIYNISRRLARHARLESKEHAGR